MTLLVLGLISYAKNGVEVTKLSIVTKGSDNKFSLSGAKYTIKKITTDENNNEVIEDAKDYYGNLIGNEENIDGTAYRIITSNENGEINLDLPSGKYRITEIVAPTGYKLNKNNSYDVVLDKKGDYSLFYTNKEWEKEFKKDETRLNPLDIKETTGEEYIALVEVVAYYTVPAEDKEDNQPSELKPGLYIFRYNVNNKIKEIVYLYENAPRDNSETNIKILNETEQYYILYSNETIFAFDKSGELVNDFCSFIYDLDMYFSDNYYVSKQTGDITIVGHAYGENTIPAEQTSWNKEITFGEQDLESNILIQLNSEGKVNWVIDFKDAEIISNIMQRDSNVTINIRTYNDIILNQGDGDIELQAGAYNLTINNGQVENTVNLIGSFKDQLYSDNNLMEEYITADFGTLSFIDVYDEYTIQPENTVNNEPIQLNSELMYVIKLNSEDKVEWATQINIPNDQYYKEVSNGYIINAFMYGTINAEYTCDGKNIDLGYQCLATIKIDKSGKVMYVEQTPIEENTEEIYYLDKVIELDNRKYIQLKTKDSLSSPKSIIEGRDIKHFNDTKLEKYVEIEEKRDKIDKQILTVTNGKEDSLQIIKQDSRTAELLPGSKFTIKKVITNADGTVTKEDAVNNDGELVGNIENINGEEIRVVTTNENGEINESLPVGKYEIVEVKAPEGYYLKPTVEENTYEVEIAEKQAEKKEWKESWSKIVGEYRERPSSLDEYEAVGHTKILQKDETGVIVYIANNEHLNIPAEDTVNNVEINLYNPVIIKYNLDNKVEWIKSTIDFGNIKKTENNEYVVNGYLEDEIEIPAEDTANNKELVIPRGSVTLKYDSEFKIIGMIALNSVDYLTDNIYEVNIYDNAFKIPAISTADDREIFLESGHYLVKINNDLKIEKVIVKIPDYEDYIVKDNEIIYKIIPEETEYIHTIDKKEKELLAGKEYIAKCNYNGDILNIFSGMDEIQDIIVDEDGYLLKVYNKEDTLISTDDTCNGEEVILKNYMYIKLDNNLKLTSNTMDFWNNNSYESYIELVDVLNDGYLLKIFSINEYTVPKENTINDIEVILNYHTETIVKVNKELKFECKLNEFKLNSHYTDGEYVTSRIDDKENRIYRLRRYFTSSTTIPAEDTVNNKEIKVSSGYNYVLYNSEFKIMAVGMNLPSSILESGYIICEYNSSEKEIPAEDTVDNQAILLQKGNSLIIYNKQMKVERVLTGYDNIYSFDDLGKIAFEVEPKNTTIIDAKDTVNNKEIVLQEDIRYIVIIDENTLKIENVIYIPYSGDYTKLNEGYLMKGHFIENQVIPAEYTADGKDIEIENPYEDYIVKYNNEGKIQLVLEGELRKVDKNDDGYTLLLEDSSGYTNLVNIDNNWNILNIIEDFVLNTSDGGYIKYENYLTNTTITKENNTTGNDIFIEKGLYLVKMNSENKIEWLLKQDKVVTELAEINVDKYFGTFCQVNDDGGINLGFLQISQETVQEQLANKVVLNVTNESDVGKVVVKYVDRETNQEIASSEEFEDRVGVDYETEAKNIQYYKLEGTPENATGTVASGTTEVIYYYDKQDFNIKTDKTISELYVNGDKQDIKNNKNNIFQVSVHRKELENTELKIKYIIKIENTGEIPGTAGIVTDQIPEGLEFYAEDNADYWQLKDGVAMTDKLDGELIEPGEYKELEIVLRCTNLGDKVGIQTNKAVAENMKNDPNFEDSNSEDDLGECELLISVGLGGQDIVKILLISIVALIVVAKIINKLRRRSK
ncbi:MAG: MucBP domain-containing protein [Clostridium sp.]|nr:MucBP domain-containing protein [Clostridium sp.]